MARYEKSDYIPSKLVLAETLLYTPDVGKKEYIDILSKNVKTHKKIKSPNYVFEKINVAYALALFQLSTLVSVFLGVNIFKEKGLLKKIIATIIMLIGATILILL